MDDQTPQGDHPSSGLEAKGMEAIRSAPFVVRELLAGGLAGVVAKTSVAPLERCKILFQTGKMPPGNLRRTLQSIYRDEGIPGLFRGNGAAVLRIVPYSAIHFTMYEHYRRVLLQRWIHNSSAERHRPVNPLWDLLAGSAAGATAVLITYPLDLVRTRLAYHSEAHGPAPAPRYLGPQVGGAGGEGPAPGAPASSGPPSPAPAARPRGIGRTLHRTLEREGVRGIYHGVGASMYGILPYAGLKFYVYQSLKQWCHRTYDWSAVRRERVPGANQGGDAGDTSSSSNHPPTTQPLSAARLPVPLMLLFGGVAGLVAQTATYPFDVVRRRMQVEALQLESLHLPRGTALALKTTPQAMQLIARQQGWRALFAGLSINYLKVVPSTAIGFTVYDSLKHLLDLPSNL